MEWEHILTIVFGIFSIISFIFGRIYEKKKSQQNWAKEWAVEVYAFEERNAAICHNALYKSNQYSSHEVIINQSMDDDEKKQFFCILEPIVSLKELKPKMDYKFLHIKNNSPNSLEIKEFTMDSGFIIPINLILLPQTATLLTLHSLGVPPFISVNYNGTFLKYSIKSNKSFLRPCNII